MKGHQPDNPSSTNEPPSFVSPFDLRGSDIWLVGGAGYLGTATAKLLAAHGARMLCADLGRRAYEMVLRENLGASVTPETLEAADSKSVQRFFSTQLATRGVPHGLVVMTYKSFPQSLDDLSPSEFDAANCVGLTSTFIMAREAGHAMASQGRGSIVLFSSMYGTVAPDPAMYPPPHHPNSIEYGVGKAGIQQMARYLGVHFALRNVRCNAISPGPFPFVADQEKHPELMERIQKRCPMGRVGKSEEIAGAVLFLLSQASTYVTGHNLAVDGGWTAW